VFSRNAAATGTGCLLCGIFVPKTQTQLMKKGTIND